MNTGHAFFAAFFAALLGHPGHALADLPPLSQDLPHAGVAMPAGVSFQSLDGKKVTLDAFKGKVILLDFWATWCEPCKDSLPLYDHLQEELGAKGLVVLAVSGDDDKADVGPAAKKLCPHATVAWDADMASIKRLGVPHLPTTFLIGRDGIIVEKHEGFEPKDWKAFEAKIRAAVAAKK